MATSQILVENLLNEFYHPNTQNWRKREIEQQLITYKNQPNSWHECLLTLPNFTNQFLWFFNASTIEHTITRRWSNLRPTDCNTLRDGLWTTYANLSIVNVIKRQRDTLAQLITLMGKREFPDDHPAYMNHIVELIKNKFQLGIIILRTTSEEVVSVKEDVSSDRKKYFHSCVSLCMPEIMNILGKCLAITCSHINGTDINLIPNNLIDPILHAALPNDNRINTSTIELLICIQHLFSWISLDDLISEYFLLNIFDLARWREHQCEISVSALSVINELFYLQRAIPLPKIIMTGIKELLEQQNLSKSNEMYQDKLTELLRLYTTKYWSKMIDNCETFPSFMFSLYSYTFAGYGALAFTERLEIWSPIIKGLAPTRFGRYAELMSILVGGILKKMQFRFDQEQELDMLDNESLDDNMETEWQHYLILCIETIALIAEGRPIAVFEQVFNDWQRPFEIFMSLEKAIDGETIDLIDQSKCHFIHCILRDLSSLCQTLVRLAPIIEGCTAAQKQPESLLQTNQCLLYAVKFLSSKKFTCLTLDNSVLKSDFIEIFAQILSAVRSLLPTSRVLKSELELKQLIENVATILLPSSQQESRIVELAAAQLLLSISSVIRPQFMIECHSIIQLIQAGLSLPHLSKQILVVVFEMIINCFVLPWQNVTNQQQDFEKRNLVLEEYIGCLARDFLEMDQTILENGQEQKVIAIITSILPILKDVLDYFKESNSAVKNMLTNAFKSIITKSLSVYNSYSLASTDIATTISDFSLSVLRTLQIQLGVSFVREMLTIFIDSSTREQLTVRRLKSVEKILQMLLLVVEQPGNSTMSLIPSILNLALEHVLPLLLDDKNLVDYSDIAYLLYSLFDGILHHRWQYFYKSQVQRGFSPGASDFITPADDAPQHSEQLSALLTSYGRALVSGNDPHITRTVLVSLQSLNERWKLYYRDFFKMNLLTSFQCALINALLSSEGALHYDLLLHVLFTMGQVNITKLHESFVSIGFPAVSKQVEDICLATDLPTFSHKMNQLIQDTRCIRLAQ